MKKKLFYLFLFLLLPLSVSCADDKTDSEVAPVDPETPYIVLSENRIEVERVASTKTVQINTNISTLNCSVYPEDWCTVEYSNGKLNISVLTNIDADKRLATVTVQNQEENIKKTLLVTQHGRADVPLDLLEDVKVNVAHATTSSSQPGAPIEKSFDGDYSTSYHSNWDNSSENYFPITLSYFFDDVKTIDYLIYYPRSSGNNGNFKEFDLYVKTKDNPIETLAGTYNFNGSGSANRIDFPGGLKNPTEIRFVVKSGAGTGQGFASCSEMEFYQKNPDNFNYSVIFKDPSCSELKDGVTAADIDELENRFFRDLAMEIYLKQYDEEFRVQAYKAWQHPDVMAKKNKTSTYGLRDNPTGIYVNAGEEVVILVDNTRSNLSAFIQNHENKLSGSSYPLTVGINRFEAKNTGLIYIMYYTETGKEEPVKINIPTGRVNGYFDSQKHTQSDWRRILDKATFKHFDVLGKYAALTFETSAFKENTPDGIALIDAYDELVYLEQDFMGLNKYDCAYKNRAYFLVVYEGYMYATGYYTAYVNTTQSMLLNPESFRRSVWGPAHELGHVHQTRPGLKWGGTTEVTNNIHSLYVQTSFGNKSRLLEEGYYEKALEEIVKGKKAHCFGSVFNKLVPFWQLKLYVQDVLGKKDFYKDVYQAIRQNDDPPTDGDCQIEFVKIVCDVAQLNLLDFFKQWGFLTPVDTTLDDYSKMNFKITQEMIDTCISYVERKGYKKPEHDKIYEITDENLDNYR